MSKYKCNECEAEFNEPDSYSECMGEFWGMPAYEYFDCCPVCKSDDIEELKYIDDTWLMERFKEVQ